MSDLLSADVMFGEMRTLITSWVARGVEPDLILSRFHCIAVDALKSAGVTYEQMQQLVAIAYGIPPHLWRVARNRKANHAHEPDRRASDGTGSSSESEARDQ